MGCENTVHGRPREDEPQCWCCGHKDPLNGPWKIFAGGAGSEPEYYCSIACFTYHLDQTCGCFEMVSEIGARAT